VTQALYRRYRPETFSDVIGQEHVTGPLMQALAHDRVHHAYLFSGPRGCGKTTSARILARCLNCEQGPTATPCGTCSSCVDLARGGGGSIDVIEIDAASHGGVDDARDLRERAFYAPASSRYKVYIIDEAHMVSRQGFNALLKLVEEPPDYVTFIFATTEPESVLPTIKSRTHHYPFRLVPPGTLRSYLATICEEEEMSVQPGVLDLVVRAGAGSVRDSLSVLDQLMGGAEGNELTYETAVGLLGVTPGALLDEVVDAFAAGDAAVVFATVDRVVETGLDPKGFLTDLLQRFRDLVIVAAVPDAFEAGLIEVADDQRERMVAQASRLGLAALTRAADLVAQGLTELRGATAPRLQLELVCAKILLPGAHGDESGLAVRMDRLERRLAIGGLPEAPAGSDAASPPAPAREAPSSADRPPATRPTPPPPPQAAPQEGVVSAEVPAPDVTTPTTPTTPTGPASTPQTVAAPAVAAASAADPQEIRLMWPSVLDRVKEIRRVAWMVLFEKAEVVGVDEQTLTIAFPNVGDPKGFFAGGHGEVLRQAMIDVLGVDWTVEAIHDPSLATTARRAEPTPAPAQTLAAPAAPSPEVVLQAREAAAAVDGPRSGPGPVTGDDVDEVAGSADVDLDATAGHELVAQELGGTVIGEIEH
jgi:DNA polymerase-3 subunit gamma/tau